MLKARALSSSQVARLIRGCHRALHSPLSSTGILPWRVSRGGSFSIGPLPYCPRHSPILPIAIGTPTGCRVVARDLSAPTFCWNQKPEVPGKASGTQAARGGVVVTSTENGSAHDNPFASDLDTIVAIVTAVAAGAQAGAVAIVRMSGPGAVDIARCVFRPARRRQESKWCPESHLVEYGAVIDKHGQVVDEVLLVPMLRPRSYTREDVVELQTHGGAVCVSRVLEVCLEAGARLAKPGEFTLRAFLNGRLDLAQAESVSQLVAARTAQAAEAALAGMQGGLSGEVRSVRAECIDLLIEMEARLDFDEDLPPFDIPELILRIKTIRKRVEKALATAQRGRLLQVGLEVAIVGRPNVGKSSLLNAWSQSEKAIVTEIAGTTRDIVEASIVVGGAPVKVLDTAGIRETTDTVERIGVERSEATAMQADVVLMVVSATDGWTPGDGDILQRIWRSKPVVSNHRRAIAGPMGIPPPSTTSDLLEASAVTQQEEIKAESFQGPPVILVVNKADAAPAGQLAVPQEWARLFQGRVETSAQQGVGLDALEVAVVQVVGAGEALAEGVKWTVNQRQAEQLVRASQALQRVTESVEQDLPVDFWTVDLREAALALGQISGDDVTEEVLDGVFSRFCIGK